MRGYVLTAIASAFIGGIAVSEAFSYFPFLTTGLLYGLLLIQPSWRTFTVGAISFFIYQVVTSPSPIGLTHHLNRPVHLTAYVERFPTHGPNRVVFHMRAHSIVEGEGSRPVSGSFRLTVYEPDAPWHYGDLLSMKVTLRSPRQFENPGNFLFANYRERQGHTVTASLSRSHNIKKLGEERNPILPAISNWRDEIRQRIIVSMDKNAPSTALLMAMVIGETDFLDESVRERFSASGITHILSISGSHLALVAFLTFECVRQLLLRLPMGWLLRGSLFKTASQWAAVVAAIPVTFYTLLAGAQTATLRSLIMILTYLFSIWIGRNTQVKVSLALAALLIVSMNPRAVFDLSFQFSFLSVLFIVLTIEQWKRLQATPVTDLPDQTTRPVASLKRFFGAMLLATLGAGIATAPLSLYYFHQFSWVGFLANMVMVPLASWVLIPFGLLCAVFSPLTATGFPLAPYHERMWAFYDQMADTFAKWPGADLHFASPSLFMILTFYGVVCFLLYKQVSWRCWLATITVFLLVFLGGGSLRIPPDTLRVTFIDVGQGDATLVEFPDGKTLLVDGGSGSYLNAGKMAIAPYLWQRRIRTLDYVVVSHPQQDHMGGMPYLLTHFEVGRLFTNGVARSRRFYRDFQEAMQQTGQSEEIVHAQTPSFMADRCRIAFLNPRVGVATYGVSAKDTDNFNDDSVVLHMVCQNGGTVFSLLLTGDIGTAAERELIERNPGQLRSTLLKVPHHGSRHSSSDHFLREVSPQIAVILVGHRNPYHHPHPDTLHRYRARSIQVFRTDRDGAVIVRVRPDGTTITPYHQTIPKKISWDQPVARQEWENWKRGFNALIHG